MEALKREIVVEKNACQKSEDDSTRLFHLTEQKGRTLQEQREEIISFKGRVEALQTSIASAEEELFAAKELVE